MFDAALLFFSMPIRLSCRAALADSIDAALPPKKTRRF